jgi:hypothetical protein
MTRALLLAVALVALAAAPAQGRIVLDQGMAGIRIGMSEEEIEGVLGEPDVRKVVTDDFGEHLRWKYRSHGGLRLTLRQNAESKYELFNIQTVGKVERTKEGIGVGSRERALRRRLSGEKCESWGRGFRTCTVGRETVGEIVTAFWIRGRERRVWLVMVGRIVD